MTDEQRSRIEALGAVIRLWKDGTLRDEEMPTVEDLIAYAEWVSDGSIAAATAIQGQRSALYREHHRGEDQ